MLRYGLLALVTSLTFMSTAAAQPGDPDERLHRIAERFAEQVEREGLHSRLPELAERLVRDSARLGERGWHRGYNQFAETYRDARRELMRSPRISEEALDHWDRLVVAWDRMQRAVPPSRPHRPPVYSPHRPDVHGFEFRGRFEETPVAFRGRSVQAVYDECVAFTNEANLTLVDDIHIGNQHHRNGPSYWGESALCAIVALNTTGRLVGPEEVRGDVEGVPFHITGSRRDVEDRLRTFLPAAIGGVFVDDVTINGRRHHNGPSYWSAAEIVNMISASVESSGPMGRRRPYASQM